MDDGEIQYQKQVKVIKSMLNNEEYEIVGRAPQDVELLPLI